MMDRFLHRLTHADALGILFAVLALLTFTYGISSSLFNTDNGSFFWIGLAAASISYFLGKSRLNGIQASAGMGASGILCTWVLGAQLTQYLLDLRRAAISCLLQIIPAIRSGTPIDVTTLLTAWTNITEASSGLMTRLQTWITGLNRSAPINDELIQNMAWMLIFWLCSAWLGWFAEKRNAVASLLPLMVLLATVTSYTEYRIESLWMMVMVLLLLMGIWNYENHTLQWVKQHIDYSDSIRMDAGRAVIFLTLAVGTLAFMTPSIPGREFIKYLREKQERNEAADLLGIAEPRSDGGSSNSQDSSLPRGYLLGGGFATSENIVMTIRTGELPPIPEELLLSRPPRYYWRSTVYDRYTGNGWATSTVLTQTVPANTPLIPGLLTGYRLVHMDVEMAEPEGRLFWSGILFSADVPFTANWRVPPPSDLFADQPALFQADMFAALTNADAYQAETYIPTPTPEILRSASTNYPEEILTRYLLLPDSLPERVQKLGHDITIGLSNPYDKARAIETYLRANYPYTLDVPPPPEGRDVAEYFLFELKKGYCDYYATAMVVLARSEGIPARFVSGYSPGTYDALNAQYVIRELNAHSWAEIYFPGIGWVEFEPTASLPGIERVDDLAPVPSNQASEEFVSKLLARFRLGRILIWSSPALVILAGAILYFVFIERWRVMRLHPEAAIDHVYQRFYRAGRPFAGAWTRAETSSEFLCKVLAGINEMGSLSRFEKLRAEINDNAILLTHLYHSSLFMDHRPGRPDAVAAWRILKRLQPQLFYVKLLHQISRKTSLLSK